MEPKGEMSLKVVSVAINISGLPEMFGRGYKKACNCWELKEFSKIMIVLNLSCSFCFGTVGDKIVIYEYLWFGTVLLTHTQGASLVLKEELL